MEKIKKNERPMVNEKDKNEHEPETQICKEPDCEFGGKPQPIENFGIHASSGKRLRVCKKCMSRRMSEGQQRRHEKKRNERPTSNVQHRTSNKKPVADATSLTIDFSNHPTVLEKIKRIASDELRTPGNQVLYWLKEFSIIVQKEEAS